VIPKTHPRRALTALLLASAAALLAACSGSKAPPPVDLGANPALLGVRQAWTTKLGAVNFPLDIKVVGTNAAIASSDGTVAMIDTRTGGDVWRTQLKTQISAGVGTDGRYAAVVSTDNDVITLDAGREIWRQKLGAYGYTAPLVAGARVFVLSGDRTVTAFDAASGRKLWTQTRAGEPLVLKQAGVLMASGDTLLAGQSGRLVGMNPLNGVSKWEPAIGTSRGTNDVERLVDLVADVGRDGDIICARSFQTAVGCVNTARGQALWSKPAVGSEGVSIDDRLVYGTESDGKLIAWKRSDGDRAWVSERFLHHGLTAPVVVGSALAFGENNGTVHFVAKADGAVLNRVSTDGSAIMAGPTLGGDTVMVVTKNGGVYGFKPAAK
jgi:outer membrane assembly lipoprotein YfgL